MVVIPDKRAAEINATVWKTSAGAVNNVRVCKVSNLNSAIARLKENGYWVYGAEAHSEKNLYDLDIDIKTVVVIGSEGNGISRLEKEKS